MMRTTWISRESFPFKSMRPVFMAAQNLFLFHKMTRTLTTRCLFILLHRKWLGIKPDSINTGNKDRPEINDVRRSKRPTKESHFKNKKNKVNLVVIHLQQHPQRGDHDIGECRLLSTEDSTAQGRFHCIVFHCCTAVHRLFPRRDDVTMLHHIFHTHTACMNSYQEERIPFVLSTILCRWYRRLSARWYYHYIFNYFYHCHTKLWLWSPDPFLFFSGQLFFIVTWASESCRQFELSPIRHFARTWLLHPALWCQKNLRSWLLTFYSTCL